MLHFFVSIPGQMIALNQHYKLTFGVYGPVQNFGNGSYGLGGGLSATVQMYQNTLSGHALSAQLFPQNVSAYLFIGASNAYSVTAINFHCANY